MSTNNRECFRCPAPDDGASAVLELGQRQLIVELIDQSAGGFAIRTAAKSRLRVGQTVKLRTNTGWCEALVVHVERVDDDLRVGLQRTGDLSDPREDLALTRNSLPPLISQSGTSLGEKRGLLGSFLAVMLALIVCFWVAVSYPVWFSAISQWLQGKN